MNIESVHWAPPEVGSAVCRTDGEKSPFMSAATCPLCRAAVQIYLECVKATLAIPEREPQTSRSLTASGTCASLPAITSLPELPSHC